MIYHQYINNISSIWGLAILILDQQQISDINLPPQKINLLCRSNALGPCRLEGRNLIQNVNTAVLMSLYLFAGCTSILELPQRVTI